MHLFSQIKMQKEVTIMKQSDGCLSFDTKIDNSGFEKGIKELGDAAKNAIDDMAVSLPKLSETAGKASAGIINTLTSSLSAVNDCGANLVSGLQNGIIGNTPWLLSNIKKWCKTVLNGIKGFFGIHSPSRVMRDEVGKYISLGVAAGIEESGDEVVKSFKGVLERLDYQKKFDIISEDVYYTELERLRDRYFKAGTKEWLEYTEKIYDYQQKLLEDEKKKLEETKKTYKDVLKDVYDYASEKLDAVIKKQQDYSKKLKSYGKLFNNVTISLDEGDINYYSLANLKKDTEEIKKYNEMLMNLRSELFSSGISDDAARGFFDEINSLSAEEGIKALEALNRVDKGELYEYLKAYDEKFRLADKMSADAYRSEMDEAIGESEKYMAQKLTDAGFEVPKSFFDTGTQAAKNFGAAFAEELDEELKKIKVKIDDFNAKLSLTAEGDVRTAPAPVNNTNNDYTTTYNINPASGDIYLQVKKYETMRRMLGWN